MHFTALDDEEKSVVFETEVSVASEATDTSVGSEVSEVVSAQNATDGIFIKNMNIKNKIKMCESIFFILRF